MKWPSLPFRQAPATAAAGVRRLPLALISGCLVCLAGGFALACFLFFPAESLKQRLIREVTDRSPVELQIADLQPRLLPPGLALHGITVSSPELPLLPLDISAITVEPWWGSLFGKNPGAWFRVELLGGTLDGTLRRQGQVTLAAEHLRLSAPIPQLPAVTLDLTLGHGTFSGSIPAQATSETRLTVTVEQLSLSGLKALGMSADSLPLGTVTLVAGGRGTALKIEQLNASGGQVQATGEGTLLLGTSLANSRINLNLTLRPGSGLDPGLTDLLDLFSPPGADGAYHLKISGAVAAPSLR